jgi:predicted GTPase
VTVEEREEYEGHLSRNLVVFTGVDYKAILAEAEKRETSSSGMVATTTGASTGQTSTSSSSPTR